MLRMRSSEQARQVGDGLRVGQDVGVEDRLGDQQHVAAVAGDHVGGQALAGEDGHDAEDVARPELAEHRAGAGVVGDGDLGVAGDQHADVFAVVAGLEDGFVALVAGQLALADDFLDLVGRKCSKRRTCSRKNRFRSISLTLILASAMQQSGFCLPPDEVAGCGWLLGRWA
jgi:hypothetical protein